MGQRAPIADDLDDYEPFDVIICQGWPHCMLEDEAAVQKQKDGCPLCRRLRVNLDGTETEYRLKAH
jgi:hypothetical protein